MTPRTHRVPSADTFALVALAALLVPRVPARKPSSAAVWHHGEGRDHRRRRLPVTALFQSGRANLQTLLETTVSVGGPAQSCVVAYFSAVVKPSDNYMVFQVTLDGVPMHGHTLFYAQPSTPVVIEMEETDLDQARMIAHQFFLKVDPGVHTVKVSVAQGSGRARTTPRSKLPCCPFTTSPRLGARAASSAASPLNSVRRLEMFTNVRNHAWRTGAAALSRRPHPHSVGTML